MRERKVLSLLIAKDTNVWHAFTERVVGKGSLGKKKVALLSPILMYVFPKGK